MLQTTEPFVTLSPVKEEDFPVFKQELQEAFIKGLQESYPKEKIPTEMGPISSDEGIQDSLTAKVRLASTGTKWRKNWWGCSKN